MRRELSQTLAALFAAALLTGSTSALGAGTGQVEVLDGADVRVPDAAASDDARGVVVIRGTHVGGPIPPPRAVASPPAPPSAREEPGVAPPPTEVVVYASEPVPPAFWWLPLFVTLEHPDAPPDRASLRRGLLFGRSHARSPRPFPMRSAPASP